VIVNCEKKLSKNRMGRLIDVEGIAKTIERNEGSVETLKKAIKLHKALMNCSSEETPDLKKTISSTKNSMNTNINNSKYTMRNPKGKISEMQELSKPKNPKLKLEYPKMPENINLCNNAKDENIKKFTGSLLIPEKSYKNQIISPRANKQNLFSNKSKNPSPIKQNEHAKIKINGIECDISSIDYKHQKWYNKTAKKQLDLHKSEKEIKSENRTREHNPRKIKDVSRFLTKVQ